MNEASSLVNNRRVCSERKHGTVLRRMRRRNVGGKTLFLLALGLNMHHPTTCATSESHAVGSVWSSQSIMQCHQESDASIYVPQLDACPPDSRKFSIIKGIQRHSACIAYQGIMLCTCTHYLSMLKHIHI